jgi:hypothetical protein
LLTTFKPAICETDHTAQEINTIPLANHDINNPHLNRVSVQFSSGDGFWVDPLKELHLGWFSCMASHATQ